MAILNIGKEFHPVPAGRYDEDGPGNGTKFREQYLVPALRALKGNEKLIIVLDDGVEGYGSSFLTEGFAGVVKHGHFDANTVLEKLEFKFTDQDFEFFADKIKEYLRATDS